ncbi:hypothetical protein SDJN02_01340, partial [Cucurbita argyrosperma subsp. argyrosperma]
MPLSVYKGTLCFCNESPQPIQLLAALLHITLNHVILSLLSLPPVHNLINSKLDQNQDQTKRENASLDSRSFSDL